MILLKSTKASVSQMPKYTVIWWQNQTPFAARFTNKISAEAAAHVRNGLMIRGEVEEVLDWYRRDEEGRPMPAQWLPQAAKPMGWAAAPHPEKL
jgi:hypothetical protein